MSTVDCEACQSRVKDWNGDDPRCAFTRGSFSGDNWMCATAGLIRDIVCEGQSTMPAGVDYQYCDDMKYATINLSGWDISGALALWVSWYKSRGGTDAMWLLFSDEAPRPPTEAECLAIVSSIARHSALASK